MEVQVLRDPTIPALRCGWGGGKGGEGWGEGVLVLDPGQVLEWSGLGPASAALRVQTPSIG